MVWVLFLGAYARTQFVCINNSTSVCHDVMFGVPQGSSFGPFLYLLYTAPPGDIQRDYSVRFHMYANDIQLYMSFKSSINSDLKRSRSTLVSCVCAIEPWMLHNNLKLILHVKQTCSSWLSIISSYLTITWTLMNILRTSVE